MCEPEANMDAAPWNDLTLMLVNWQTLPCVQLALKTYYLHHKNGSPLHIAMADNGSTDGSKEWLRENNIPFLDSPDNIGHEQMINHLYPDIKTKYCLLIDTDVIFHSNCYNYLYYLSDSVIAAGDLIRGDNLGSEIKPRLGAWWIIFDIDACRTIGITKFRDTEDWSYDCGSHFYERIWMNNKSVHIIPRLPGHIDYDILGMKYGTHSHLGKMSWNLNNHSDRTDEVNRRKAYVLEQLKNYEDIDLKNKFI